MLPCAVSDDSVNTLSVGCCWKCYLVLCLMTMLTHCLLAAVGSVTLCCVCWLLLEVLPCAVSDDNVNTLSVGCCWKCYLVLCLMTMLTHCLLAAVGSVTLCCV